MDTTPQEEERLAAVKRARLIRFYERYNPAKLEQEDTLDKILSYKDEEKLYKKLCEKYGPEPTTPAQFCSALRDLWPAMNELREVWAGLTREAKNTFVRASEFCVSEQKGDVTLANRFLHFYNKVKRVLPKYMRV